MNEFVLNALLANGSREELKVVLKGLRGEQALLERALKTVVGKEKRVVEALARRQEEALE